MSFLDLLSADERRRLGWLLLLASTEGITTGLLLPLVNYVTVNEVDVATMGVIIVVYAAGLLLGYVLRVRSGIATAALLDGALRTLRTDIARSIRAAELRTIEGIEDLQTAFTRDIERLEELPQKLIDFVHYSFILLLTGVYVLVILRDGVLIWVLLAAALAACVYPAVARGRRAMRGENSAWSRFHTHLSNGLGGYKQLKLDPAARRAFTRELELRAKGLAQHRFIRDSTRRDLFVRSTFVIEFGLGVFLFAAPAYVELDAARIFEMVTVLFFTLGPSSYVAQELHTIVAADVAARNVLALRSRLAERQEPAPEEALVPRDFQRIELCDVSFAYRDASGEETFTVGPLNLVIDRGALVIIRGGNGSGKTTMMKLLAGLYQPSSGELRVDGERLSAESLGEYRERFTAIFGDQHLFKRAYGLDAEQDEVDELLRRFKLADVTAFKDGRFTKLDLSSGQHKRLAMIIALLERRPILLFDEWDAHQDPELRMYYYTELLPALQAEGRTIIAVSHDDRHFHRADVLVHLESGRQLGS